MNKNYYKVGSYNVICDFCQSKRKREDVRPTWDGFMACVDKGCWSPKHPNETPIPVIIDGLPVYDARPRTLKFIPMPGGVHQWTDSTLSWDDPTWTWDDDDNLLPLFSFGGNP